jgi:hypothetical protein
MLPSPYSSHSRDASSSDTSSGEWVEARIIFILLSPRVSLDSSDDVSQVEDKSAGKNASKSKRKTLGSCATHDHSSPTRL